MDLYNIIAQTIGIVAMGLNILSFQQKNRQKLIVMQLFGASLFTVNMFMLGATVGALMNLLGVVRAVVFSNRERFRADKVIWVYIFSVLYLGSYILTFTVFGKEPVLSNLLIECLPVIGMVASSIGFYLAESKSIRKLGLISSPSWLIYNVFNFALGGIICEILSLISIVIGIFRHDIKRKDKGVRK